MALIQCTNCAQLISSRAKACPKCGQSHAERREAPTSEASPASAVQPLEEVPASCDASPQPAEPAPSADPAPSEPEPDPEPPAQKRRFPFFNRTEAQPEETPQPAAPQPVEEWYYVAGSGRGGPVDFSVLRLMVAQGHFGPDLPVWKAGMPDWVKFSEIGEDHLATAAPQDDPVPQGGSLIWALALAPLVGCLVQWWIVALINLLLCFIDLRRFTGNRRESAALGRWLWLAPPLYLYRRDRTVGASSTRATVWTASCLVSIGLLIFLNGMYLPQLPRP